MFQWEWPVTSGMVFQCEIQPNRRLPGEHSKVNRAGAGCKEVAWIWGASGDWIHDHQIFPTAAHMHEVSLPSFCRLNFYEAPCDLYHLYLSKVPVFGANLSPFWILPPTRCFFPFGAALFALEGGTFPFCPPMSSSGLADGHRGAPKRRDGIDGWEKVQIPMMLGNSLACDHGIPWVP